MKYSILILFTFILMNLSAQKNYLQYSAFGATPYVGLSYERTYLNQKLGTEFGIGILSFSVGSKFYLRNAYIGASHYLFLIPSDAGFKTYIPFGFYKETTNGKVSIDIGPNFEWYDRNPNLTFNFGVKYSKEF